MTAKPYKTPEPQPALLPRRTFLNTAAADTPAAAQSARLASEPSNSTHSLLIPPPDWAQVPLDITVTIFDAMPTSHHSTRCMALSSGPAAPWRRLSIVVWLRVGGYGILYLAFRPGTSEIWAAVGGGIIHRSVGGKTWKRYNQVDKLCANIYKIKFFEKDTAFARDENGLLLKYDAPNADGA